MKNLLILCLILSGVAVEAQKLKSPIINYDATLKCIFIKPTVGDTNVRVYLNASDVLAISKDANYVYFSYREANVNTTLWLTPTTTFKSSGVVYTTTLKLLMDSLQVKRNKLSP